MLARFAVIGDDCEPARGRRQPTAAATEIKTAYHLLRLRPGRGWACRSSMEFITIRRHDERILRMHLPSQE
jgi:hypothetical protein